MNGYWLTAIIIAALLLAACVGDMVYRATRASRRGQIVSPTARPLAASKRDPNERPEARPRG